MVRALAPLGIEILGSHTDYNEGLSLAAASQFGVTLEGRPRQDQEVVLNLEEGSHTESFRLNAIQKNHHHPWANPVKGVVQQLLRYQIPLGGFEVTIHSHLPPGFDLLGGGILSAAASLLLQKMFPFEAQLGLLTKICHDAELQMGNTYCGLLGIIAGLGAAAGSVLLIDFRTMEARPIALPGSHRLVVCDSGVKNMLVHSKVKLRKDQCSEALRVASGQSAEVRALRDVNPVELQEMAGLMNQYVFRTAMHVVSENQRVREAVDSLGKGDITGFGANLNLSHLSCRDSIETSTPQIDELIDLAKTLPGFTGSRMMGYGFGGPTIHLVQGGQAEAFAASLPQLYSSRTGKKAGAFTVDLSAGGLYL